MLEITAFTNPETDELEVVLDSEGNIIKDARICAIQPKERERRIRRKDGTTYQLKVSHSYTTVVLAYVHNRMLGEPDMKINLVRDNDTGDEYIKMVFINNYDKVVYEVKLSTMGAWDVFNGLMKFLDKKVDMSKTYDYENIDISTETLIYIALLNSPSYTIIKKDVVALGANPNTVPFIFRSLVKKKMLVCNGKIGNSKTYTCTIPPDKLERMFGRP